jgi:hypothetical protein
MKVLCGSDNISAINSPSHQHSCTSIYPSLQQSAVSVPIQSHHVILAGSPAGIPAQVSLFPITEIIGSFVVVTIGMCCPCTGRKNRLSTLLGLTFPTFRVSTLLGLTFLTFQVSTLTVICYVIFQAH